MDGTALRLYALGLAACYPLGVGLHAAWKLLAGIPDKVLPWPEVAYGPAITVVSALAMILAFGGAASVVSAIKDRVRSRP